jgi:hypothetical protein
MYAQAVAISRCGVLERDRQGQFQLYHRALKRGRRGQIWSTLVKRSRRLLDLASVEAHCVVSARCDAGLRTVPIDQIRGSEGRVGDFDCDFHPLRYHTQERWLGIAAARQRGKELPPVALVQVGDLYFVRDGHHRISVARALGQTAIEARVIVWQVAGPLPWETPSNAPSREPAGQLGGIGRMLGGLRRESAGPGARTLPGVDNLVRAVRSALKSPAVP